MNFYEQDPLLKEILREQMDETFFAWAEEKLHAFGGSCAHEIDERARHTDGDGRPQLIKYDRYGNDQSYVWVNEGYRETVRQTYEAGIVGYVHKDIPELGRRGSYLYSFAQGYLLSQSEPGFYCPVTLTMAAAYLVEQYADRELREKYLPHLTSTGETELFEGATFLTERQGGSDVGANDTTALEAGEDGKYRLYGEKYFASNAGMCGVAMVLARINDAEPGSKGLSLFLVPWRTDEGALNNLSIRRLKDKLGVRAVPSAEVEFDGAEAFLVGDRTRGFYYMMEALNLSRICNSAASIGIMRRAFTEAESYAKERKAFGRELIQYPMVQDTLVRMKVKLEAETRTVFSLVHTFDGWYNGQKTKEKDGFLRLLIALVKAETADQSIHFSHEAIEMHGGNGYIEDFATPRLLRDAQVLTVWEGTRNILGLEVLRLFEKFQMDEEFTAYIRKEISPFELTGKQLLLEYTAKLEEELQQLRKMEKLEKTRHINGLSKKMVVLLESLEMLRAAGKETDKTKQERKQTAAAVFLKTQLHPLWGNRTETWTQEESEKVLHL
ncbi:acyl-CoA dehydrogenase family protein [Alkalicoccus halolimnae]|uniref:Acyl-CoA dehydrogenase family protein n=1 Tax=Alkalicoccus halolimnae TaxID=1667239 RepID=A0A5C7FNK4_9BACI|nr:acyl-CoA dehydrogenase family protein [Alkalicoccus halolimnae]TXF86906.1 isovaleryl-CoA dehydrogenase [Alkalicoccus halolimnae]